MAVNDPKWANGSIVLMQSTDVAWLDGSVLFDFEYAAAGGVTIPPHLFFRRVA